MSAEPAQRHYWEEKDPAAALAMLEEEMADIALPLQGSTTDADCRGSDGMCRLRKLLERECMLQVHAFLFPTLPGSCSDLESVCWCSIESASSGWTDVDLLFFFFYDTWVSCHLLASTSFIIVVTRQTTCVHVA
jgi:hypothetical protein